MKVSPHPKNNSTQLIVQLGGVGVFMEEGQSHGEAFT